MAPDKHSFKIIGKIHMSDMKQAALDYHALPKPGKISVELTKPADTARDLSLAYSPGVAEPVREIAKDPENAYKYTAKGNLVAVITDGSAILGLGNLGPLASKPVMEGKSLLFKRFAGVDSIDLEVDSESPQAFIDTVKRIADTFGGINLEDIKAPECFEIERVLIEQCNIPVFHDDQHGTAIVTVAGMLNALEIQGKKIEDATMVCLGAGAAANACTKLLISAGMKLENVFMLDRKGVIHSGREDLNPYKAMFASETDKRTLDDAITGADIFLGLSGPNLLTADQLKLMAPNPIVFACSNPDPEIAHALAIESRDDLIMATGRSDYPNQVNNVLGFPFIFRGALDVRAAVINEEMKLAAAYAIRDLAKVAVTDEVLTAYGLDSLEFGRDYIIPKATDSRLLGAVSAAVAKAAVETGVAKLPYPTNYPLNSIDDI
jgi:malate dehydrogenase (oxaloacetate-decarboxylating)(NADP+)